MARAGWLTSLYSLVDERLRAWSKTAKRSLLMLRLTVAVLIITLLGLYGAAVGAIFWPEWIRFWFAGSVVVLSIPLLVLAILVALPLRLKSVTRLIDKGYPGNAREIGLRLAARKLRDESIETEELLAETAWNEGKKAYRKYRPAVDELLREKEAKAGQDAESKRWRGGKDDE